MCVIGIVGGAALLVWHFVQHPIPTHTNEYGARVADAPPTPEKTPPAAAPKKPAIIPAPATPAGPADNSTASTIAEPPIPAAPQGDDKIQIQSLRVVAGNAVPGSGDVVGEVQNTYAVALTEARVSIVLTPKDGQPIPLKEVRVRYIPPKSKVPFSVSFEDAGNADESAQASGSATGIKADEKTVCWLASDVSQPGEPEKKVIYVLNGKAHNESGGAVNNVRVYADFFLGNGVHKEGMSAEGTIDNDSKTLGAGKTAYFTLTFDTAEARLVSPDRVKTYSVRVIAQKP
jgi:hypothetical protein